MKKIIPYFFIFIVVAFLLFLIRPALFGQLNGTFKTSNTPADYVNLENYLSSQPNFFRTLWLPTLERFGYYSKNHPAMPAGDFINTPVISDQIKFLEKDNAEETINEAGIKYVIVPSDIQGEIFIKDREYDEQIYKKTISSVQKIPWLKKINRFGKIAVFENTNFKNHFWTSSENLEIKDKFLSPVEYVLDIKNAKKGDIIVFSDSFDARWFARDIHQSIFDYANLIGSDPYKNKYNSFILREDGDYSLDIYYYPQLFVILGSVISILALITILVICVYLKRNEEKI